MRIGILVNAGCVLCVVLMAALMQSCAPTPQAANRIDKLFSDDDIKACRDLLLLPTLTIIHSDIVEKHQGVPAHCYVRGLISGSISWHAQLPAPSEWSGRMVHKGDGGLDGDLDFRAGLYVDSWLRFGDAVVNSNTGHDAGVGPNWALQDEQAIVDFGYRAVHLTANAGKTLLKAFYGRRPANSYHVGCSNGGRQGLIAAQRFPADFDGIVVGAPSIYRAANYYHHLELMQHLYRDDMAANLGSEGNAKINRLHEAVLATCDTDDGVRDGVVGRPEQCRFNVDAFLDAAACEAEADGAGCFTEAQANYVRHIYAGSRNESGELVYPGAVKGSEYAWDAFIGNEENHQVPYVLKSLVRRSQSVFDGEIADIRVGEWRWWQYDAEYIFGDSAVKSEIIDAVDPDLRRYFAEYGGKLILYHGWDDPYHAAEPLIDYYLEIVETTFSGDQEEADKHVRLFMMPGVEHCNYGPGPDRWERLAPIKQWVESGVAPDRIISHKQPFDVAEDERPLCPWPQRAEYTGPPGTADDPASWVQANFDCR